MGSYKSTGTAHNLVACSGQSEMDKKTLNNAWVSVGGHAPSSTPRNNRSEDILLRCEDARYEMDMVFERTAAAVLKLEPIASAIAKMPLEMVDHYILPEGALSAVNLAAIQRIYGSMGREVVKQVKLKPGVAIPVVLKRMQEKYEVSRLERNQKNMELRKLAEANYHRSLDHRGSTFKVEEQKQLSRKALLAEVFDIPDDTAVHRNDICSADTTLPNTPPLLDSTTGLHLSKTLKKVHRIIYSIVSAAILESAEDETEDRTRATVASYRKFLETFFGIDRLGTENKTTVDTRVKGLREQLDHAGMYGDESIYLFFRLHQLVAEKLTAATSLAAESAAKELLRQNGDELGKRRADGIENMLARKTAPSELTKEWPSARSFAETIPFQLNAGSSDSKFLFDHFLSLLPELLTSSIEPSHYEECCMTILGPDSYILFTMEHILRRLTRQVVEVFHPGGLCHGLFDTFYKARRNIVSSQTNAHRFRVEELYSLAAASTITKGCERGANLTLFQVKCVHFPSSALELAIVIYGSALIDSDKAKQAQESVAIHKFISSGNVSPKRTDGDHPDAADDSVDDNCDSHECGKKSMIDGFSVVPEVALKHNESIVDKAVVKRDVEAFPASQSSPKRQCTVQRTLHDRLPSTPSETGSFLDPISCALDSSNRKRKRCSLSAGN